MKIAIYLELFIA